MIIKIVSFVLSFIIIGTITVVTTKERNIMIYGSEVSTWLHTSLSEREVADIANEAMKTTVSKVDRSDNMRSTRNDVSLTARVSTTDKLESQLTREDRVCLMIEDVCKNMGFQDTALIKAIVKCESNFDTDCVSNCNAQGLMQIMPKYFGELMQTYGVSNLCSDARGNLQIGIHWMQHLLNKYSGDIEKALVAYNCGESAVDQRGITSNTYSRWVLRTRGDYL